MSLGFTLLVERFTFTFLYCLPLWHMLCTCSQRSKGCLSEKSGSLHRQLVYQSCNETNTFYPNSNTPGHLPQSSCISKSCGKTYSVIIMVEMLGRIFEEANLNSSNYWKLLSAFYHHPRKTKVSNISIFTPRLMQMPFLHLKPTWTKNDVMKAPRALCDLCTL